MRLSPCAHSTSRAPESKVNPFEPVYPLGFRNRLTPSPSFHLKMEFFGMSEKSRYRPSRFHAGPSTQVKPSAIFSSFASRGTNLSKRASRRTIVTGTDVGLLLGKAAYDQSGS